MAAPGGYERWLDIAEADLARLNALLTDVTRELRDLPAGSPDAMCRNLSNAAALLREQIYDHKAIGVAIIADPDSETSVQRIADALRNDAARVARG